MKKIILLIAFILTANFANSQTTKKKSNSKAISVQYSEEKALEFLEDYFSFYNADEAYRNPNVRRVSNNVFYISLQTCINKTEFLEDDFHWNAKVYVLKIQSSTKYTIKEKFE
ncbi:hypothetical protein [Flavobacterium psychrophilum]|uniref:hypothetical protein n=1 Tax=Flavobacterium psychrophilum TaxID=96345 RepID=UPI001D0910B2|nr:hypothetical protein [Flavobacterium psychrophilum]MCB6089642.1 hypothetical protein [Flavobacterium psychrophilum]MCB6099582.1 hypothetical protein [Flavobacterium psychrophilum]